MELFWVAVLFSWLLCGIYASEIAKQKQAASEGFWIGILLGPVGVIAAGFLDQRPNCRRCGGRLNSSKSRTYRICPHCKSDFVDEHDHEDTSTPWEKELEDAHPQT